MFWLFGEKKNTLISPQNMPGLLLGCHPLSADAQTRRAGRRRLRRLPRAAGAPRGSARGALQPCQRPGRPPCDQPSEQRSAGRCLGSSPLLVLPSAFPCTDLWLGLKQRLGCHGLAELTSPVSLSSLSE